MNKILLILLAVVVVGGGVAAGLILTRGPATASLPTLSTGNQWVYDFFMVVDNGTYTGTLTQTVTGQDVIDDTDCYTLNWTFDPDMMGVTNFTVWLGKDTLMENRMEMSGIYVNVTYRSVTNISYEFGKALWPLEVGKEVAITYNENTTVYMDSVIVDTYNETINGTMKMECKEKVTVAAGEFDCFKVLMRDEGGNVISRAWYADKVKGWVKSLSYEDSTTITMSMELKAYSV